MGTIYALLVGINDYSDDIGKLKGCLNDVDHLHEYLDGVDGDVKVEVIKDNKATRSGIIQHFQEHLIEQAGPEDTALFQYCGHGALWKSAPEFRRYYGYGKDEGLVCYDSHPHRLESAETAEGYDLADKELAVLLSRLAEKDPHICLILDCCHSGSATRGVDDFTGGRPRQTHEVFTERPLETYIGGYYSELKAAGADVVIPDSRHVSLAACKNTQKAYETENHSGAFTDALVHALSTARSRGEVLSYGDLFASCRAAIRTRGKRQTPQFDSLGNFDASSGFLGGVATHPGTRHSVYFDEGSWKVEYGAIHGAPTDPEVAVGLRLFPEDERAGEAGAAHTSAVGAHTSDVELDFDPPEDDTRYWAEITSLPAPPIPLHLFGEPEPVAAVRALLEKDRRSGFEPADSAEGASYEIEATGEAVCFRDRDSGVLIREVAPGDIEGDDGSQAFVRVLQQVGDWERFLALQNKGTKIDAGQIDFELILQTEGEPDRVISEADEIPGDRTVDPIRHIRRHTCELSRDPGGDGFEGPGYFVRVRNRSDYAMHVALFETTPRSLGDSGPQGYGIKPREDLRKLEPGEPTDFLVAAPGWMFYLPQEHAEETMFFKLVVSRRKLDAHFLEQRSIALGKVGPSSTRGGKPRKPKISRDDWLTKTIEVRLVPGEGRLGKDGLEVAGGRVSLAGHPTLQADVCLSPAQRDQRGAGADLVDILQSVDAAAGDDGDTPPFSLLDLSDPGSRSTDGRHVLELSGIDGEQSLGDSPLEVRLDVPLDDGEAVLPLCFDGEHILIGGESILEEDGRTLVRVGEVTSAPDTRSLGKAFKLYFFKTYLKERTNRLCWVEAHDDGTIRRHREGVASRARDAQRILLLIHGIIGDTKGMAEGVRHIDPLSDYDLVLTYDYENLNTPIEETAEALARDLAAAGVSPDATPKLTILAHSMGGLVSRYFIEHLGGHQLVDHLVLCGTPNGGSPYGDLLAARKLMTLLTTIALNSAPAAAPFAAPLLLLLHRSERVTRTLDQMRSGSDFFAALNAGDGSSVDTRYTVLAGDVAQYEDDSNARFAKLFDRIAQGELLERFFEDRPHDIAAKLDSIFDVGGRASQPEAIEVACHHLNYFSSEAGREALASVDWSS